MRFHTTYKVYTDIFDVINCEGVEKKNSRENVRQLANHHLWHRISRVNCDPKKKMVLEKWYTLLGQLPMPTSIVKFGGRH